MKRSLYKQLINWQESPRRKPLLLQGARQVGKTYLLKQLGKEAFSKLHYLNLEDTRLHSLFSDSPTDTENIIFRIEAMNNQTIDREKDLLVFDEIQDCPKAIQALKYFCENHTELAVACAGSRIGVSGSQYSFPVGKVTFLNLYPLDFQEFLWAYNPHLAQGLEAAATDFKIDDFIHQQLWQSYLHYSLVGGMPEAVTAYIEHNERLHVALTEVKNIQSELIQGYTRDFSKYCGKVMSQHITRVFKNIPGQLQAVHDDSTARFRFKDVINGPSRFVHLQGPINWLTESGLVLRIPITQAAELPLESASKENMFKLFVFDLGILSTQLNLPFLSVLDQGKNTYKGFIAENFVAQQLQPMFHDRIFSWAKATSEIEFLLPHGNQAIPLEVKSGSRVKAKSLAEYKRRYNPSLAIKLSAMNIRLEERHLNAPIYLACLLGRMLENLF